MVESFWHQRWRDNDIPFHEGRVNGYLKNYYRRLGLTANEKVFVPLCGKALDMVWIRRQQQTILGVELSPIAVRDFFSENDIAYRVDKCGAFERYSGDGIELLCGDLFDMIPSHLKDVRAVYDRASYFALDIDGRRRYADFFCEILPPGTNILLLALEYPQSIMDGPPYSVGEAEVRDRFETRYRVTHLETRDIIDKQPRFRAKGLPELLAHAFLLADRKQSDPDFSSTGS